MRKIVGVVAAAAALLAAAAGPAAAQSVSVTNLTSDGKVKAAFTDAKLINPWGISFTPTGPFWVSDNGAGVTTVYSSSGQPYGGPLVVTIPPAAGQPAPSAPTGQVYNPTTVFRIAKGAPAVPALFLFATEGGTISGWAPNVDPANAITTVDRSASNAIYKGMALYAPAGAAPRLLLANFGSGFIEVFDGNFALVASLRDGRMLNSYRPFNVAVLGGRIFVTYAQCCAHGKDDIAGAGHGAVEEIDITGKVLRRIATGGALNSPWGLAVAPSGFGAFAGALLVGNFGDGRINAFNLSTNALLGPLTSKGAPLAIPGLWALQVGNGGLGGSRSNVYFTAGPFAETHGLFGALAPAP